MPGLDRIKKLSKDGGQYVQPSFFLFLDLALKAGLSAAEIDSWTPGMIFDLVFFRANEMTERERPKPPTQDMFDDF